MSKKLKGSSKLGKCQQNKRIQNFIKYKMITNNNESFKNNIVFKKSVTCMTNSKSPSIIKIVPSNKITMTKNLIKTFTVKHSNNMKIKNVPSTNNLQTTDHAYISKNYNSQSSDDNKFKDCNHETNNVSANKELFQKKKMQVQESDLLIHFTENKISNVPDKLSKVHSKIICCSCRETLDIILQQQEEILSYLKNGQPIIQRERKLDLLPTMPFNDINDFLDFDESLTHENVQDQFIIKLKKLLVSTEQKSVSNILSSIMTNELCRVISWIGIKNTVAFGTTNMVGLIIDLIQEHHQLDIDNVKARIAEWLRRCGDRIGNEIRKNKKRAQHGYTT